MKLYSKGLEANREPRESFYAASLKPKQENCVIEERGWDGLVGWRPGKFGGLGVVVVSLECGIFAKLNPGRCGPVGEVGPGVVRLCEFHSFLLTNKV